MFTKQFLAAAALAATSAGQSITSFDANGNTNMAVYWGQGPSQQRLAHFCADSHIDIIPIAFLNIFPDQVNSGYPGTNFGNQCGSETYKNKDDSTSPLLSNCPFIGPDIKTCQAMGKKILLSLGGAIPTNQSIKDNESAKSFAKFLWNAFGPEDAAYDGPRPFGDAVVDGFDFDIESAVTDNDPTSQYRGYDVIINTLRTYFVADADKEYYISGAPQCVVPDANLAHAIEFAPFDFLFIQFYNTPQCSARAYFDASYGRQGDQPSAISFDAWVNFIRTTSISKDVKLYIGLPAAPLTQLTYDTKMYIAPDDVQNLIDVYQCRYPKEFGGIMVFEATYSEQNLIDGKPYVDVIKGQLTDCGCAQTPVTSTTSSLTSTTSSVSAATSITASSAETTSSLSSSSTATASASTSLPSYPSSTGIWNSTYTTEPTAPTGTASSSMSYPSSTGIWNSTNSLEPTAPIGTGSSSVPYPSSTGLWNTTTYAPEPTAPIGTGSSAISHPSSTGLWNTTSTIPTVTGSSSIPTYSTSTGIWNTTYVTPTVPGTSVIASSSSFAPVNTTTSASSTVSLTSLQPSGNELPRTHRGHYISRYDVKRCAHLFCANNHPRDDHARDDFVFQYFVCNCPPEVTSCPAHTVVTTYPVTMSSGVPVSSVPTIIPGTTTSHAGSSVTHPAPASTTSKVQEMTTIIIVTSYTTTCPVTGTTTVHGTKSESTTFVVSTVTSSIVSTIPALPVPTGVNPLAGHGQGPATIPSPEHEGSSSPTASPPSSGNSSAGSDSHPAPHPGQPQQPAHGGSSSPAFGGSSPSSATGTSPVGLDSDPAPRPGQPQQPEHGGSAPSSGTSGNSPINGSGNSPDSSSNQGSTSPSSGNSPAQPQQPANGASSSNGNSPVQAGNFPQGAAAPGFSTTLQTSTRQIAATVPGGNSSAGTAVPGTSSPGSGSSSSLPLVVTQTLIPVPLHPSQTAQPAGSSSGVGSSPFQGSPSASAVPSAPFPAGNGTVPAGPIGSYAPSASVSGSAGGSTPTTVPFTGAASRMGTSLMVVVLGVVTAMMM
ncbi:MAG: hypothetical protein Q9210_003003 [Variospora velana]